MERGSSQPPYLMGAIGFRIGIRQASQLDHKVYRRLGFQEYGKLSVYLWENNRDLIVDEGASFEFPKGECFLKRQHLPHV